MTVGKNEFEAARRTTVAATPQAVFDLIIDFRRWAEWSSWEDLAPALQRTCSGPRIGCRRRLRMERQSQGRPGPHGDHQRAGADAGRGGPPVPEAVQAVEHHHVRGRRIGRRQAIWRMVGPKTFMTKVIGPDFEKGLARLGASVQALGKCEPTGLWPRSIVGLWYFEGCSERVDETRQQIGGGGVEHLKVDRSACRRQASGPVRRHRSFPQEAIDHFLKKKESASHR